MAAALWPFRILYVNGDPVEGTFVEATKTFTEGTVE